MKFGQGFRDRLQGTLGPVGAELDAMVSALTAWRERQHDIDGSHGDVTASSMTVNGRLRTGGPWEFLPRFGSDYFIVSPPALTANQDNWKPNFIDTAVVLRASGTAARTLTGLRQYDPRVDRLLLFANVGSFAITLANSSASSIDEYQFDSPNGADWSVPAGLVIWLFYDSNIRKWRILEVGNIFASGSSFTDNALVRWDGTTGTAVQSSAGSLDDDGTLTVASVIESGVSSPTTTGSITGLATADIHTIRMNNASDATIHGLAAGVQGQRIRIISVGAGNVLLAHQSTTDGTAANRLINWATSSTTPLAAGSGVAEYEYDATTARWRLIFHEQGAWLTPTFAAGDFTANGLMTWTVASGDVSSYAYRLTGKTLTVNILVGTTTVGGTLNNQLFVLVPGGFTITKAFRGPGFINDNGTQQGARVQGSAAGTTIAFLMYTGANYAAATDNTAVAAVVSFEVD